MVKNPSQSVVQSLDKESGVGRVKAVERSVGESVHLTALSDLLEESHADPVRLFEHGLALLVETLGVDRALLTRVTGLGFEVFWWAVGPGASMEGIFEAPEKGFCPYVIANPDRPLVIKDAAADPLWRQSPAYLDLGIRAYAGVALKAEGKAVGSLCVQHHEPHIFSNAEFAFLRTIGHLMARTMESEHLKEELRASLEALELSSTVLEDSALQSVRTGLPNRRFLDIWLRSALFTARRRNEPMAMALWTKPLAPGTKGGLSIISSRLRGQDLLVELSTDQYLLLMPNTTEPGASLLLERLRDQLGPRPIGATVWPSDGKDMTLKSALRRVAKAFTDANREGSDLVWIHA